MATTGFGVRLPVAGPLASTESIVLVAQAAEQLSYDALWVHDYLVWTRELDRTHVSCGAIELVRDDLPPTFFESLTTLTYVAALTSTIRLGTAVLCVPYRNPILTGRQIANLDVLSNGRLILGVGVGARRSTNNQDFEVLQIPRMDKYERAAEYVDVMRRMWTGEPVSYDGTFVSFPEIEVYPTPIQRPHPPIWVGGAGPRAIQMAAAWGDGWLPAWLTPEQYRERIAEIHAAAAGNDRAYPPLTIGNEVVACIAETDSAAVERSRATLATLTQGFTVRSDDDVRATTLIGSPGTIRRRIDAFVDAGVDHFELKFIYHSIGQLIEQLDLFSREVAPHFRP